MRPYDLYIKQAALPPEVYARHIHDHLAYATQALGHAEEQARMLTKFTQHLDYPIPAMHTPYSPRRHVGNARSAHNVAVEFLDRLADADPHSAAALYDRVRFHPINTGSHAETGQFRTAEKRSMRLEQIGNKIRRGLRSDGAAVPSMGDTTSWLNNIYWNM